MVHWFASFYFQGWRRCGNGLTCNMFYLGKWWADLSLNWDWCHFIVSVFDNNYKFANLLNFCKIRQGCWCLCAVCHGRPLLVCKGARGGTFEFPAIWNKFAVNFCPPNKLNKILINWMPSCHFFTILEFKRHVRCKLQMFLQFSNVRFIHIMVPCSSFSVPIACHCSPVSG